MTTIRAGLIGAHISRSRLEAALRLMCEAQGMDLDFTIIDTADRPGFELEAELRARREEGWTGLTVTHPWKGQARALVGQGMRRDVAHLGAANTLIFGETLVGYNTDYTGFLAAYREADLHAPGRVVMQGAGGVAEALGPALLHLGAEALAIGDLDPVRAERLAAKLGPRAEALSLDDLPEAMDAADGLVNATPLGMAEHPGSAFGPARIGGQSWAFDAVYTPTWTPFLSTARQAGLVCLTGFDLFRAMAVRSFEVYRGSGVDHATLLPRLDALRPD